MRQPSHHFSSYPLHRPNWGIFAPRKQPSTNYTAALDTTPTLITTLAPTISPTSATFSTATSNHRLQQPTPGSCTVLLLIISSETKASGNLACSVPFTCTRNSRKFCSNKCYPSVLNRAAAKRLAIIRHSSPTATKENLSRNYVESPSRSPAARSHDRSWATSPLTYQCRALRAVTPGRITDSRSLP